MNIHEYQGKEILASYGVRIQRAELWLIMQLRPVAAAKQFNYRNCTTKSVPQAKANKISNGGGRGKGWWELSLLKTATSWKKLWQ